MRKPFLFAALGLLAGTPALAGEDAKADYRQAYEAALTDPSDRAAGLGLMALLPAVEASFGPPRTMFVLEGDLLVDEADLARYRLAKSAGALPAGAENGELIVHVQNGQVARWPQGRRTLRFAVLRGTFPDAGAHRAVAADMARAAAAWADACPPCGVRFEHRPEWDGIATWEEFQALAASDALRFVVVYNPNRNGPIASAFFPTDPWAKRMVSIFPRYFSLPEGTAGEGVLRHELGHVLGYRHEHTRDVPGCVFEDANWVSVTPYDPQSVMHYWCGDGGNRALALSDVDRAGHGAHYAPAGYAAPPAPGGAN